MNEKQFNLLAKKLIKSSDQRDAVRLVVIDGLSAYEAEKRVHGAVTSTVSRDAKKIIKAFEFSKTLIDLS